MNMEHSAIRDPRDTVMPWVACFNAGDPDGLAALYHVNAINHQVMESPLSGREAIREMFTREFAAVEMVCLVENLFQDGEWAILEWRDPLAACRTMEFVARLWLREAKNRCDGGKYRVIFDDSAAIFGPRSRSRSRICIVRQAARAARLWLLPRGGRPDPLPAWLLGQAQLPAPARPAAAGTLSGRC